MMKRILLGGWVIIALASCRVQRFVPEAEVLYGGSTLRITMDSGVNEPKALQQEMEDVFQPAPNASFLGLRTPLWLYYRAQRPKTRKVGRYLNKKFGEKPVYAAEISIERTKMLLTNRLENRGFFDHEITETTTVKRKKYYITYTAKLESPYRLQEYTYLGDSTLLNKILRDGLLSTDWRIGERYDLERLKAERERLDITVKNEGFYQFNPDYLIFRVDTSQGDRTFKLYLSIKKATPPEAKYPYRLSDITIFPNHQIRTDGSDAGDTVYFDKIAYVEEEETFKPRYLSSYLQFAPKDAYSLTNQRVTTNRLSSVGNFKYVQINYSTGDSIRFNKQGEALLDVAVYLSPHNKRALRFEAQALSKSNNFVGPALLANYKNRNLFKGGELLQLTGKFGFETQLAGGRQTGLFAYEVSLQTELVVPRLIVPFEINQKMGYGVPKTRFVLGASSLNRVDLYRLNAAQLGYGFQWQKNRFVSQEYQPLAVSFTGLAQTSPAFDSILNGNNFLRRSFEQRFIAGTTYSFLYTELAETNKEHRLYGQLGLDLSGNLMNLVQSLLGRSGTIFGQTYAQYARIDLDLRHYWQLKRDHRLVSRLFAGYGIPLGATASLPYIKQYFAGGPNSVRAFRIRSIGPGTYRPTTVDLQSFFDQAGDIRLEMNMEYRFPIAGFLKGATFIDAGNIWLANDNPDLPGARFSSSALQELALGAGVGLRIDIDFVVLRFDLATPLRKPWLPQNQRWFDYSVPAGSSWRKEHLILNFAIGYPF
jgi:outer membrane protein assembly factor BamA